MVQTMHPLGSHTGLLGALMREREAWEPLKPGFHSSVYRAAARLPYVVKEIRKDIVATELDAHSLGQDIHRYALELKRLGVNAEPPREVHVREDEHGWSITTVDDYAGPDLRTVIQDGTEEIVLRAVAQILGVLGILYQHPFSDPFHAPGLELEVGIDPKPENFAANPVDASPAVVDFIPARYRRLGEPLTEVPPPRTEAGRRAAYLRHYHMGAILTVLLSQLCRLRPDLHDPIAQAIHTFARGFERNGLAEYMDRFPGSVFVQTDRFDQREQIIAGLGMDHIYAFRYLACYLAAKSPELYGKPQVEKVFHLTHFEDALPESQLASARATLLAMMHQQPL